MTAAELRALARGALEEVNARGFVRFAPEGDDALLLTDAPARLGEGRRAELASALRSRGFVCASRGTLLALTPGDALLSRLFEGEALAPRCGEGDPLAPACALADRWLRAPRLPLTARGARLVMETARLLWRPREQVLAGLCGLRALAATLQRGGERSGLRPCGVMLARWCAQEIKQKGREAAARTELDDRQGQEG